MDSTPLGEFKVMELADKDLIDRYLQNEQPSVSELTFTNLFMWRHYYRPLWFESDGVLFILARPLDKPPFAFYPLGAGNKMEATRQLLELWKGLDLEHPVIGRADTAFSQLFQDSPAFRVTENRDQADYVYLSEDLARLAGRKMHKKKNHFNYFIKNYEFQTRQLDKNLVHQALELQESWCQLRECAQDPGLHNEDQAVYEALSHFEKLDFQGVAILIEGKVEAFGFGERLNDETAVFHVEKANPEIRGLYVALTRQMTETLFSGYKYINREQDLGVEGLREAKKSFQPDHLVEKYEIIPN